MSSTNIYTSPLCSCVICRQEKSAKGIHSHFITAHTYEGNKRVHSAKPNNNCYIASKLKSQQNRLEYSKSPNYCCVCGVTLSYASRHNRFCSHSCSAYKSNKTRTENGFTVSSYTKQKISTSLKLKTPPYSKVTQCKVCKKWYNQKNKSSVCSTECKLTLLQLCGRKGGKASNKSRVKRSKDEIKLFNLCSSAYLCKSNMPLVDGWDSDIFIPQYRIAIMWNGPWHYKEMKLYNHSLSKVQARDMLKISLFYNNNIHTLVFEDRYFTPETAFEKVKFYINLVHGAGNAPALSLDLPYQDSASLLGQP